MGALHLCWCLGVILVLPNIDARNVKLVPAETKTITTNGATHEISRYILVPDDQSNANAARTIEDALRHQIANEKRADGAHSETNIKSDDIKDINDYKVKTDNAKESKFDNVHDLIKTIHILHAKHDRDGDTKSEIPASVKYHHSTGSHKKNHETHSNHDNSEVIGNWHKIKNDGKGIVEHTRVILNFKPQHKVAESKVIYIKHNKEEKDKTNLKQGGLKMHIQGQKVQVASRGGHDINADENTAKVNNLSKITQIKYSELPIKDLIKSGGKGDLTSIGINKTFTIPGQRGRFKLLHEHDDYDDVIHEKHVIQHYPLPKHKTVTHYYTSKYTVGRTVHGKDDEDDLSLRSHKIETNRGAAVAHETRLDNKNFNIGLLRLNSDHGKSDLQKNINHDENNDGEITIHKSSAPVKKSNSIYSNSGVVNLHAKVLPEHEENTFLQKKNHADQRKQNVYLDTNLSDEVAHNDEMLSLSTENDDDNLSYRASISPSAVIKTHHSQTEHEIIDASHDKQSLEGTDAENSLEVVSINDDLDTNVLIENRNNVDDTEPTANDKIKYNGDYLQRDPNAIVFPQDSAESYEIHDTDTESANTITTTDTPDPSHLPTSSEHNIKNSSIEIRTSEEHSTEEHSLDDESHKDVSKSNSNENPIEDNIQSVESYETPDTEIEKVSTITPDTREEISSSTSSELDNNTNAPTKNRNSTASKEHSTEKVDGVSDENNITDGQVVNEVHTTPIAAETSSSDKSEELPDATTELSTKLSDDKKTAIPEESNNNLGTEPRESVDNEDPKIEDANGSTEEIGTTQSPLTVPIENDSSVSDEAEESKIVDATEPSSEVQDNTDNNSVPDNNSEDVSTMKTVPISDETDVISASQEKVDDVAELSTEELGIDEKPIVQETSPVEELTNISVETEKSVLRSDENISKEITQDVPELSTEAPVLENENKVDDRAETVPLEDETSASDETEKPGVDDVTKPSSEITENENNITVPTTENALVYTAEPIPVSDETHAKDESEELENEKEKSNEVVKNVTEEDNVEIIPEVDDKSIDDESDEPEINDTADSTSEVLENVGKDNVSKTDEVDDKDEAVPSVKETSASNETEESETDDSVVPEDNNNEHIKEDANKFIPAKSQEPVNPKDISGSESASDESVIDSPSSKEENMIISDVDDNNNEIPNTISTEPPITDYNIVSTPQPISEEKEIEQPAVISPDEPLTPEHADSSEISTESDQQGLTSDEIAQLENVYEQYRKNTEATDSPNIPVQESQNDYMNFEHDSPSEDISGEIEEPKHIESSQEIPEPENENSGYEVMQPNANDKESSENYPEAYSPELSDREEATRDEHDNTHPTVNVHLTRFPITNYQQAYPTTYQNTIAYPNIPNVYSPNANYETSDQYLQYLLGYLTSANVMQQLRQKYALGYEDMDKVRQAHIINILQGLGVHRISQENYLQLAEQIKQLEDSQKDIPKAETIDVQTDNQIPSQYYYMPYANVYPSVQTPKLTNAYVQRYLFQNVDANASNTAVKALSDRVLSIVVYLRRLRIPEYRISQFVTEVKKYVTPAAIQSFITDCKNKVFIGLREKIDLLAKQAMQRRCLKCRPAVYALPQNH